MYRRPDEKYAAHAYGKMVESSWLENFATTAHYIMCTLHTILCDVMCVCVCDCFFFVLSRFFLHESASELVLYPGC